jgi:hypothetical protein
MKKLKPQKKKVEEKLKPQKMKVEEKAAPKYGCSKCRFKGCSRCAELSLRLKRLANWNNPYIIVIFVVR